MSDQAGPEQDVAQQPLRLSDFAKYDWQALVAAKPSTWMASVYAPLVAEEERLKGVGDSLGSSIF